MQRLYRTNAIPGTATHAIPGTTTLWVQEFITRNLKNQVKK
jgi:hypothetical protein